MADWDVPFDKLAARVNMRVEQVVRAATLLIFQRVVVRSPVDTGRFRANWLPSYGAINTTTTTATDPTGNSTQGAVRNAVLSFPVGGIVYLCNSLPYAMVLEYGLYPNPPKMGSRKRGEDGVAVHTRGGYSMQAPNGMVRITAAEFRNAVAQELGAASS